MGIFHRHNTLDDVVECRKAGGVIIDVRTAEEYATGRIPGSINIPVNRIEQAKEHIKAPDTPVCVYCQSGIRAATAAGKLKSMGYTNVKDLGGIGHYRGKMER